MAETKQQKAGGADAALPDTLAEFSELIEGDFQIDGAERDKLKGLVANLALAAQEGAGERSSNAVKTIKKLIDGIDQLVTDQMNEIMHSEPVQKMEGIWRGLEYLVKNTETDQKLMIKVMNITKDEIADVFEEYDGIRWDKSPLYKKIYQDQYSTLGGKPFGALIGDFEFSHNPKDVAVLKGMSGLASTAHAPFIAAASPKLLKLSSWEEVMDPDSLEDKVASEDYASWNSLRLSEDARYLGLAMPRALARLPYDPEKNPVKGFKFVEDVRDEHDRFVWMNAAYAMGVNINRSHKLYGWGTQIRGVQNGGTVMNLPVHTFTDDNGEIRMKCPTEISIDDRRERELSVLGMMPLIHRKSTDMATFIGAMSLQDVETRAGQLVDPDAAANERLSGSLPYLFPVTRFSHYLKAIARDWVGKFAEREDMQKELTIWIKNYVHPQPNMATQNDKARKPLAAAEVEVDSVEGRPGYYSARFFLRPHFQLEGLKASLRLVSELPSMKQSK